MQKRLFLPFALAILLLVACSLSSPAPAPAPTVNASGPALQTPGTIQGTAPTSTGQPTAPPVQPTSTPLPPSPTPSASPSPTPTAISLVLGPENASQIAQVFDYADAFRAATGKDIFDLTLRSYALARDGNRLAFGLCASNDSSFICNSEADNDVLVLNTADGSLVQFFEFGSSGRLAEIALSADGESLYTLRTDVGKSTEVESWDVDTGESLGIVMQVNGRLDGYPRLCLSPDSRFIAASLGPLGITVYGFSEQSVVFAGAGNYGRCSFSQDGQNLFVFLRDANSAGRGLQAFDTHGWTQGVRINFEDEALGMNVSPDGSLVAVVHDNSATVWDLRAGTEVTRLEGPAGTNWQVKDLAFSPDGRMLAVLIRDFESEDFVQIGKVWETGNWGIIGTISGMSMEPLAIRFDSRGEQFVVFDWFGPAQRFALPGVDLLAAQGVLEEYLAALSTGDYERAAELFIFDPLDPTLPDWIRSQGGDPDDMAATFEQGCRQDAFPCLPLQSVYFAGRVQWSSYLFVVTFEAENGAAYVGEDGYSDFWLYAEIGTDGNVKMTTLHPGIYGP